MGLYIEGKAYSTLFSSNFVKSTTNFFIALADATKCHKNLVWYSAFETSDSAHQFDFLSFNCDDQENGIQIKLYDLM